MALLIIVLGAISAYYYTMKKVDINQMIKIVGAIVTVAIIAWSRLKYLKWKRSDL